jgi:hypothetical protein
VQSQQPFTLLDRPFWTPLASAREPLGTFFRRRSSETLQAQLRPLRRGVMEAFVNTCQRWNLPEHSQAVLLGYGTNPTLAVQFLSGSNLNVPQDARDRIGYIVGISVGLGALFNEVLQAEVGWLNKPHPALQNQSPLAFMLQGPMVNVMKVSALVAQEQGL